MPPVRTSINREAHSYRPGERPWVLNEPGIGDYAATGEQAIYHVAVAGMAQDPLGDVENTSCLPCIHSIVMHVYYVNANTIHALSPRRLLQ